MTVPTPHDKSLGGLSRDVTFSLASIGTKVYSISDLHIQASLVSALFRLQCMD